MVRIKLKRIGKKKNPFYNIVIMEKLSHIKGKYIDKVGYFDPLKKNLKIRINISESTYQLVKDHFKCNNRGKINAKYKGEINMYFVESTI